MLRPKTSVKTDPKLVALLKDGSGANADRARDFFLTLATCNTIVPIVVDAAAAADPALLEYQGESPDEQALVYAAAAYGYTLVERTSGHIIVDVFGSRQRYVRAVLRPMLMLRTRPSSANSCFSWLLECSIAVIFFW